MYSVTQLIKKIKQPKGGFIPSKSLEEYSLIDENKLNEVENIPPSIVGIAVDYLTRFITNNDAMDSFRISLLGAAEIGELSNAKKYLANIKGLDNNSIVYATKLSGYDVCFRAGIEFYKPVENINPNNQTIENVRILVNRCLNFFNIYGPVTKDGMTFEGGYSGLVSTGDGDFITEDTLWDIKVSKNKPTKDHTLQLLMYLIMGKHSIHSEFQSINKMGIFNPRLNKVFIFNYNDVDRKIIEYFESKIFKYEWFLYK